MFMCAPSQLWAIIVLQSCLHSPKYDILITCTNKKSWLLALLPCTKHTEMGQSITEGTFNLAELQSNLADCSDYILDSFSLPSQHAVLTTTNPV